MEGYGAPHQSVEYQQGEADVADDEGEAEDYGAEADEYYLRYDSENDGQAAGADGGAGNRNCNGNGSVPSYVPQFEDEGEDADVSFQTRPPPTIPCSLFVDSFPS